jgi:hypothetical protein
VNFTAKLILECSRIMAILVVGIVTGFAAWIAAAWLLLAIVNLLWSPVSGNDPFGRAFRG